MPTTLETDERVLPVDETELEDDDDLDDEDLDDEDEDDEEDEK